MNKFLFTISILSLACASNAQIAFQKMYVDSGNYFGRMAKQTFDGGYIIVGTKTGLGSFYPDDIFLIRTNSYGDTLWTKTFGGLNNDEPFEINQTADSGFIVVGGTNSFGAGNYDIYLLKISANGNLLWSKTLGDTLLDQGYSVQQTSDGGYIITGIYGSNSGSGTCLIKTNSLGNPLFTKVFTGFGGGSVQQTTDGGYVMTGIGENFGQACLIKTDSFGDLLWQKTFDGINDDRGESVHQTSDGGYIIGGLIYQTGFGLHSINLIKTDANGDTLWTKTYGGADYRTYSITQTNDGGYALACIAQSSIAFSYDNFILKTDSVGNQQWLKKYGGINSSESCYSIQQTFDGGFVIGGFSSDMLSGITYAHLIKTDSLGNSGCNDSSFFVSNIPYTLQVTTNGSMNTPSPPTVTSPSIIIGGGCSITALCTSVTINEIISDNLIILSPNPTEGNFIVSFQENIQKGNLEIFNILGENVFAENIFNESKKQINLINISDGIYIMRVFDGERSYCNKLLVKHD